MSAEQDAIEFGLHAGRGHGWRLGLLVARSVEPGRGEGGDPDRNNRYGGDGKVSAQEFAKRAGTSAPRVLRYFTGWRRAADDGIVPTSAELRPDHEVDVSKLPPWKDYYRAKSPEPEVRPASWGAVKGWHNCSVADLVDYVEPGSVDVFITDPPYPFEFLSCYSDLSHTAAKLLKPGGLCVAMAGQSYLPAVLEKLGEGGLRYHWTISYLTPGGQAVQLWDRNVNTFWKPVFVHANGTYEGDWFGDVAKSDVNDNDKDHHHWGQSESGMADLIRRVSKPGDLVCDPFLGGGTTAVVAAQLGRRVIGSDIDANALETARTRFA